MAPHPGFYPSKRQLKLQTEGRIGSLLRRPPAPQNDFTPRATRRRRLVGQLDGWRVVWTATRGYSDLMQGFAERLAAFPGGEKDAAKLAEISRHA